MAGGLILALETSTGCGSVSLTTGGVADGRVLAEITCRPDVTHSRQLLSSVQWLLHQAGTSWEQLTAVAVDLGPGSFTGLRIGLAAAKGMAMAAALPMVGVCSLDAIAVLCGSGELPLWVVMDARKQEVYAGAYSFTSDGIPVRTGEPAAIAPHRLLDILEGPVRVAGPGLTLYGELFAARSATLLIPPSLFAPRAAAVGLLAGDRFRAGELLDVTTAAPLYIRASEAEVNLRRSSTEQRGTP
ncbi:MAG: tRNA (adenosine(37)-N6)-threonylcarbamoyltransferase complex dimerization subunit type 1 TsaB [Desulfobulbus propionicus]|nr:MAG: tRNA (adenosine(37)-N6)-threonylcarbamoyltransferase complex dimerization subunit type 1 TsaB [Desulfobulbus propionicus]